MNVLYKIVRPIVTLFVKIKFNPKIVGIENLKECDNFLLAGNHTNNYDSILIMSLIKKEVNFVAKKELLDGVKGLFFKNMNLIPVNRKIKDKTVIPECVKRLNKGNIVVIFPEGTINRTEKITMPFKKGATVIAKRSGCNIVPFAINGCYKKNQLKIIIGKPYKVKDDIELETYKLQNKVESLLKDMGV